MDAIKAAAVSLSRACAPASGSAPATGQTTGTCISHSISWFGKLGGIAVGKRVSGATVFIVANVAGLYLLMFLVVAEVI